MPDSQLAQQLGAAVRDALAPAARYVSLVTRTNPLGTAEALLARPDIEAVLLDALSEALGQAQQVVQQAWDSTGAQDEPLLSWLLSDLEKSLNRPSHLRTLIRHAHAAVPVRQFVPGVTPPGTNPVTESGAERAELVRNAILRFAETVALRSRMTASMAEGTGATHAVLDQGYERLAAGENIRKRWRAHVERPTCCKWCRKLNGVTIPLGESFEHYLGGMNQVPHPPRPYRGWLQGPLLHPFCQCWLELVPVPEVGSQEHGVPGPGSPAPQGSEDFLAAADVRAMPEAKYRGLMAFLRAGAGELGRLLRRLGRREGSHLPGGRPVSHRPHDQAPAGLAARANPRQAHRGSRGDRLPRAGYRAPREDRRLAPGHRHRRRRAGRGVHHRGGGRAHP